jgi:hypothetical protein
MPRDFMKRCQILGDDLQWRTILVKDIPEGSTRRIRCHLCHGAVRPHWQRVPGGPADHVEHHSRQDSTGCRGGIYFPRGGTHRLSLHPVS